MKVSGVFQANMIQAYSDTKKKATVNQEVTKTDSLQISQEARNLMSISNENVNSSNRAKVEDIKNQIQQGTYEVSPALIAQRMMAIMKGSEV